MVLKPGNADIPVECELAVYHRAHRVPYEALSYAWGEQTKNRQIFCNGSPLQVTESLETALRHLRSPTEARKLWVDAVCIDQGDASEKGLQIRLMNTIYSEAERVLVWLGSGTPETEKAFRLVNRVVRHMGQNSYWGLLRNPDASCPSHLLPDYVDFSPSTGVGRLSRQDLNPLLALLSLPWFTRLWVFQGKLNPSNHDAFADKMKLWKRGSPCQAGARTLGQNRHSLGQTSAMCHESPS